MNIRVVVGIVALLCIIAVRVVFGTEQVEIRQSRQYTISATPIAVGIATNRRVQEVYNDTQSEGSVICGYSIDLLSITPGPDNGNVFAPGFGKVICEKADMPLYCMLTGGDAATINNTDAYIVTATTTPTATPTPTS